MKRSLLFFTCALCLPLVSGCAYTQLQRENANLRREVQALRAQLAGGPVVPNMTPIQSFTVGLAASESSFKQEAFEKLLQDSLVAASENKEFKVSHETDERQVDKIRGMLVQQYLAAEEVPITITNLSYKLQDPAHEFKIGGQIVPRENVHTMPASSSNGAVAMTCPGPIHGVMHRDAQGRYSIAYEELGAGGGNIPIQVRDVEILDPEQDARAARQGDISLNWNLNLEKLQAYRIEDFKGDVGKFLLNMRYPSESTSISQYQTLRDFVFLFGYGPYMTSLVNQIRTESFIDSVDVMSIDEATFKELKGGMDQQSLLAALGSRSEWVPCKFVSFQGSEKIWERPASVQLPFVSRQTSAEKSLVFYTKYDTRGAVLIGDYEKNSQ